MTFQVGNAFCFTSNLKHGYAPAGKQTKTYRAWQGMLNRCRYPGRKQYGDYGGRGITVCARWNPELGGCFDNFLADMGESPAGTSLDRKENNDGYHKENCHWATKIEQARNQRSNINITIGNETHCVAEWARKFGIRELIIYKRLYRGWSQERAVTTSLLHP